MENENENEYDIIYLAVDGPWKPVQCLNILRTLFRTYFVCWCNIFFQNFLSIQQKC